MSADRVQSKPTAHFSHIQGKLKSSTSDSNTHSTLVTNSRNEFQAYTEASLNELSLPLSSLDRVSTFRCHPLAPDRKSVRTAVRICLDFIIDWVRVESRASWFSDENEPCSSGSRRPNAARERSRIQNLRDGMKSILHNNCRNANSERSKTISSPFSFDWFLAFQSLQSALPAVPPSTKLSKLDVLLMASAYIAHLSRLVEENGQQDLTIPVGQTVTFHPVKVKTKHKHFPNQIDQMKSIK